MEDIVKLVDQLQSIGPYGLLVIFIIGLFKEWVVIGPTYKREVERSKYFQELAERALPAVNRAVELASERSKI